jgi:unsaturated chondroitin disaccharide hydrolase
LFSPHWELQLGWTGGFWVGSLWRLYARSHDPEDLRRANAWNQGILGEEGVDNHDRGFVYYNSSAMGYERAGNLTYLTSATKAAEQLAWMFNAEGTGLIPIYTASGISIIDTMMNLPILWWHHERIGDKPHLYEVAVSHSERTRREFIRPDGSTWQSVHFNRTTGAAESRETRQGLDNGEDSTWSRGQAWAMYGFSEAWRATQNPDFLAAADKVSEFYLSHQPEDRVPWFDFSPRIFDDPRGHLKDSSAAAIAAAGLLNLAEIHPDLARKTWYRDEAESITQSLIVNYLAPFGENDGSVPGMLLHGCWYWKQPERRDSELIWGTYYLLDALQRLLTLPEIHSVRLVNLDTGSDQIKVGDPFQIETQVSAHRLAYTRLVADLSQLGGGTETEPTRFDQSTGKAVWSGLRLQSSPTGSLVVRLRLTDGLGRHVERSLDVNVVTAVGNWADHIPAGGDQ